MHQAGSQPARPVPRRRHKHPENSRSGTLEQDVVSRDLKVTNMGIPPYLKRSGLGQFLSEHGWIPNYGVSTTTTRTERSKPAVYPASEHCLRCTKHDQP